MTLVTSQNFKFDRKKHSERGGGLSSTVPDMVMSIKDILANNTIQGQIPTFHSFYTGDVEFPDVSTMDLVEIDQYRQAVGEDVKNLQKERKEQYARKQKLTKKLEDEVFDKKYKERQAALKTAPDGAGDQP